MLSHHRSGIRPFLTLVAAFVSSIPPPQGPAQNNAAESETEPRKSLKNEITGLLPPFSEAYPIRRFAS